MLKKRLIPRLLVTRELPGFESESVVLTTRHFEDSSVVGQLASQMRILDANVVDEVILVDLDGSRGRRPFAPMVLEPAIRAARVPLTIGGGIGSVAEISAALSVGADKVVIGSRLWQQEGFMDAAVSQFGSQCIVCAVDVSDEALVGRGGGKRTVVPSRSAVATALRAEAAGAGEVIATFVDRDGTRQGMPVDLVSQLSAALTIPLIACGGCGTAGHVVAGFTEGGADAVGLGTILARQDQSLMQIRARLHSAGVPVRQVR